MRGTTGFGWQTQTHLGCDQQSLDSGALAYPSRTKSRAERFSFMILALAGIFALPTQAAISWAAAQEASKVTIASSSGVSRDSSDKVIAAVDQRFGQDPDDEKPDFQKHVIPLLGRLGCNGRACHGAFSGKGGFQLSLFGYDFDADHHAITNADAARVDLAEPLSSLILDKPTDAASHEGGKRFDADSWEFNLLLRWIENGASRESSLHELKALHVEPPELFFGAMPQTVSLKVVAEWEDGTREDVTPLCRFRSNDDQYATVTAEGVVEPGDPGDTHVVVFYDRAVVPVPVLRPVSTQYGDAFPDVPSPTAIDGHINSKLRKLGIVPSELADDATFLRRVYLDVTGTLPTPEDAQHFLHDDDEQKRSKLIDQLLESPAYAAWWTTKLCDFTGNSSEQLAQVLPKNGQAPQDWYDWIFRRVETNQPYDEIVAGIVTAKSRQPNQTYTEYCEQMSVLHREDSVHEFADLPSMPLYWARRDFRDVETRAINFAYAFMGVRLHCAQCHKHPFDQWTKDDFQQFSRFFSRVALDNNGSKADEKGEFDAIVNELGLEGRYGEMRQEFGSLLDEGKTVPFPQVIVIPASKVKRRGKAGTQTARLLNGPKVSLDALEDPRVVVMEWLRDEQNPYLATAFVNRVWSHYFGRGIVHPPDDLSLANPPSNEPLLTYLARAFREHNYDMRWLHREILNSNAYQRSWQPNPTNVNDNANFSHALPRMLPAEVIVDVMRQATLNSSTNQSHLTDLDGRAIAIPGTTNGRQGKTGNKYALQIFGRSTRESSCDCDRAQEPSLLQTIYRQNDREIYELLDDEIGWIQEIAKQFGPSEDRIAQINSDIERLQRQIKSDADFSKAMRNTNRRIVQPDNRQARLRKQLQSKRDELEEMQQEVAIGEDDVQRLIELSYLRTLSRYPSEEEASRAKEFLVESAGSTEGIRGLLWALLNTKEFVVNH